MIKYDYISLEKISVTENREIRELCFLISNLVSELNSSLIKSGKVNKYTYFNKQKFLSYQKIDNLFYSVKNSTNLESSILDLQKYYIESVEHGPIRKSGYRKQNVVVINKKNKPKNFNEVPFVAVDYSQVSICMNDLFSYIQNTTHKNIYIKMALVMYQFCAIHPFEDANGRTARALSFALISKELRFKHPIYVEYSYFEQESSRFFTEIQKVNAKKKYRDWCVYFLETTARTLIDIINLEKNRK